VASATLERRLADQFAAFEAEYYPTLPQEICRGRADRYAYRVVESLRVYVSELAAESLSSNNWPRADALGDLFEAMNL
jgi:hypothetical protein